MVEVVPVVLAVGRLGVVEEVGEHRGVVEEGLEPKEGRRP